MYQFICTYTPGLAGQITMAYGHLVVTLAASWPRALRPPNKMFYRPVSRISVVLTLYVLNLLEEA